jgi:alpha-N-arabinofuranosidase
MAAIAQLVNCLQSLFLAHEDKFVVTPTFHVFDMYSVHQGKKAVRTVFSSPRSSYTRNGQPATIRGLSGSASLDGRRLVLTVTNPDLKAVRETEIAVRGATVKAVKITSLTADNIHAHNSFQDPHRIEPKTTPTAPTGNSLVHRFAPASVTRLEIDLV